MILEMERIRIVGPRERLPDAIALLQETGAVHVESAEEDIARIRDTLPSARRLVPEPDARQRLERNETLLEQIRALLLLLPPVPGDAAAAAALLELPPGDDALALAPISRKVASLAARVQSLIRKRKGHEDELSLFARYEKVLRVLSPLIADLAESTDLECTGIAVRSGEREAMAALEEALAGRTGGHYEIFWREVDRETTAGLLVFPRDKGAAAKGLLWERNIGEIRLPPSVAGKPLGQALGIIRRKRQALPSLIGRIDAELATLARRWSAPLADCRRRLESRVSRFRVSEEFFESRNAFILCGWLPKAEAAPLREAFAKSFGGLVVLERLAVSREDEEQAPVALRNGPLVRPFERLTRALPLPRYGTIDPTPLMAVFFPLFYGAIIGDIGHGVLILAGALAVRKRYAANPAVVDFATIFCWAALSTILWGFAYGEFFGDLGERFGLHPLLFDRMENFLANMGFALAIGACHVVLGIALGIATAIRRGARHELVAKSIGLAMVLSFIAAGLGVAGFLPRQAVWAGGALVALSLPALILTSSHAAVMEFHNLVNIMSYLRIMGIGVATVSLSVAANKLAVIAGTPWAGIPAAAALHAVNIAFGVFSPAIQSLRLHYVEFFENFFVGGGRPYVPFRTAT
jgi:V/A-type H+-transporting ATPase subunit I